MTRARLDDVVEAIVQRFVDEWADRTPFALGNESFDPPDATWLRLWVRGDGGEQETLGRKGQRKFNRPGRIIADIRTLPGGGQAPGMAVGEELREIFEGERFGPFDLRFGALDHQDIGEIEDGRWWASTAECRFDYTDTR